MKRLVRGKGGRLALVLLVALLFSTVPAMSWASVAGDLKSGVPLAQVLTNALKAGLTLEEAVAQVIDYFHADRSVSQRAKADELAKLQAFVRDTTTMASASVPVRQTVKAPANHVTGHTANSFFPPGRAIASPTK